MHLLLGIPLVYSTVSQIQGVHNRISTLFSRPCPQPIGTHNLLSLLRSSGPWATCTFPQDTQVRKLPQSQFNQPWRKEETCQDLSLLFYSLHPQCCSLIQATMISLSLITKCFHLSPSPMRSLPYCTETGSVEVRIWSCHLLLRDLRWCSSAFGREFPSTASRLLSDQVFVLPFNLLFLCSVSCRLQPCHSRQILGDQSSDHKLGGQPLLSTSELRCVYLTNCRELWVSAQESFP